MDSTEGGPENSGNMMENPSDTYESHLHREDLDVDTSGEIQLMEEEEDFNTVADRNTLADRNAMADQESAEVSVAKFSQLLQGFLKNKLETMQSELQQKEGLLQKEKEKVRAAKMALMKKERGYLREKERLRKSIQEGEEELKQKTRELNELKMRKVDEQETSQESHEEEEEEEGMAMSNTEESRERKKKKRKRKFVFF